jgi:metal-sulfur cluster biosynthetic enzyme
MDAKVLDALREVLDPELGVSIVDIGLVYRAEQEGGAVWVELTMTSAACPLGDLMVRHAEAALRKRFPEAKDVRVELVSQPPWTADRMTSELRHKLGWSPM